MSNVDFKESASLPEYIYRKDAVRANAFQILRLGEDKRDYLSFGEYVVVDQAEEPALTEKRVSNLVAAMNEKRKLPELGEETKSRTLFHVEPGKDDLGRSRVVFRTYTGDGVSHINATFTFEGEIE